MVQRHTSNGLVDLTGDELEDFEARLAHPPAPRIVSRMQAKQALQDAELLATVQAAIAGSGDADLQLYWAEASHFHRDHPALIAMTAALGMTADQVDALFRAAAVIV